MKKENERIRIIENEMDFYEIDENCMEEKCQQIDVDKKKNKKQKNWPDE